MPNLVLALLVAFSCVSAHFSSLGGGGMNRRRILASLGGGQRKVAYRVVEWIGFRGAQAITTGISNLGRGGGSITMSGNMAWNSTSNGRVFSGVRGGSGDHAYFMTIYGGTIGYEWGNVKEYTTSKQAVIGEKISFVSVLGIYNQSLSVNGTVLKETESSTFTSQYILTIGCCNTAGTTKQYYGNFDLYDLKITNPSGVTVRDYVGAVDENGVYCLIDLANLDETGKPRAYYNEGTGSFAHGEETGEVIYYA